MRVVPASMATFVRAQLRTAVKGLAERWKTLEGRGARTAVTARVDHLGASTFVEKGWSKLSLGDAAGAETALRRALELAPGDNEAESLRLWVDPPDGWQAAERLLTAPAVPQAVSEEERALDFELKAPAGAKGKVRATAYALYHVCDDRGGACRQSV